MSETARQRLERAEALFFEAKQLPRERRGALLAQRCPDDELRREVAALLELEDRAGGFLDRPADPWIGRRIDRWRVLDRLGAGGMGVVYLAVRDDGVFEQKAALKLLRQGLDRPDLLERFHRERQVLAGLSHPNIARLIDGGTTPEGVPYFVMELAAGTRLDRWCDERRLPLERRLERFLEVCSAVQ
jgi:serine/threonine protein kinase